GYKMLQDLSFFREQRLSNRVIIPQFMVFSAEYPVTILDYLDKRMGWGHDDDICVEFTGPIADMLLERRSSYTARIKVPFYGWMSLKYDVDQAQYNSIYRYKF